jgi:copper transport protein
MVQMSFSSFCRRVIVVLGIAIGVSLLVSDQIALAHNAIESSSPADGEFVAAPLNDWVISFTNDVPLNSASAEIINADGVRTPLLNPTHGDSEKIVRFPLPENLSGIVSGRWRLVSTDGHVVSGRVQFTITTGPTTNGVPTTLPSQDSSTTDTPVNSQVQESSFFSFAQEPTRWALRLTGYSALFLLGGLLFAQFNFAQGVLHDPKALLTARGSALALTIVPAVQGLMFVSDLNDSSLFSAIFSVNDALSSTPGSMFLLRALSGGAFIYLIAQRPMHNFSTTFTKLALLNALVYLTTLSYTGHARSFGAPWLGIPVDMAHTAASAIWLGGLIVLIFLVAPRIEDAHLLNVFMKFGDVAKFAVITIIVTGVIQTLRLHSGITTLFTSSHGQILLLKLVVVALMLKVGDINRRRLLRYAGSPSVAIERKRALLVRASCTEAAIGAVVVAVTAALVTSSFN